MTSTVATFEDQRVDTMKAAPDATRAMIALQSAITVDPTLAELVKIRASILNGCAYCMNMHTKEARAAGETEQRIYALAAWHEAPFFSDSERAALALTDAVTNLHDGHVSREVWTEAAAHFDEGELTNLLWLIGAINVWNRMAIAARKTIDS